MKKHNPGALAAHLENVAYEFSSIGSAPEEGKYIGLEATVENAISHIMTALFPFHFGNARERFVEPEKRTQSMAEFRARFYNLPLPEEVIRRRRFTG